MDYGTQHIATRAKKTAAGRGINRVHRRPELVQSQGQDRHRVVSGKADIVAVTEDAAFVEDCKTGNPNKRLYMRLGDEYDM